jgi:hypothetical protein
MNDLERVASLEARVKTIENDFAEIKDEQSKLRDCIHGAELESSKMGGKITNIENILVEMAKKKMRTVDVAILIIGLAIGATSAYAAIQNNQLTRVMVQISQELNGGDN